MPTVTPADWKAARLDAGLTTAQAAAVLGRTRRNWQQWEAGTRTGRPELLELFKLKTQGATK